MAFPNPLRSFSGRLWGKHHILPNSYHLLPESVESGGGHGDYRRPKKPLVITGIVAVALLLGLIIGGDFDAANGMSPGAPSVTEQMKPRVMGLDEGVSDKSNTLLVGEKSFRWTEKMLSWQRTAFHFQPEKNWMNDPNGPVHYKGWYHFFYQYNPDATVWGKIVWGHAASKDLIHWRHLPIAMLPDQWYDSGGVWTGSATVLPTGELVMLYTSSSNASIQVQNLAYPANSSDPLLIHWVKYSGNPILFPPPGIDSKNFRDPTTAWSTVDDKWRITIGSKVNRTSVSLVYETKDFKQYSLLDGWLHGVLGTGMWECVDFYPISEVDENGLDTSANGPGLKHVLKVSVGETRDDYYALGAYNSTTGKWVPEDSRMDVGIGLKYDYGTFYASKTFYDQSKKRRILWGWIKENDNEDSDAKKGWASLQAIPRTVLLDKKTGKNLIQWPVEEVEKLRANATGFNNVELLPGAMVPLDISLADQLDIWAEFELNKEDLEKINGTNETYNCSLGGGATSRDALGPFGISVLANRKLSEQTPVYFYVSKGIDDNLTTFICVDQTRSSLANDVIKEIYGSIVPVIKGEKLSMRILVDHSIVESFAQGGRTCITSRVYPIRAIYGECKIFLFNNATSTRVITSLNIYQMDSSTLHSTPPIDIV